MTFIVVSVGTREDGVNSLGSASLNHCYGLWVIGGL